MANLAAQTVRLVEGRTLTMAAASVGGDRAPVGDGLFLLVRNDSAGSVTVTLDATGETFNEQPVPDTTLAVAAASEAVIPLLRHYLSETDGMAGVSYSAAASVTVAVLKV